MTSSALERAAEADTPGTAVSVTGRRWTFRDVDPRRQLTLQQTLGISDFLAGALAARGLDVDSAPGFLAPTLKDLLPDPSRFKDMDKAAARIADAVIKGERICIFADYDVDGATSSAVVRRFLRAAGVESPVYIPDRMTEGYGPSVPAMDKIADAGARVLIMLDCGTTAFDPLARAAEKGMDVVIIDHHEPEPSLPKAFSVVNPNRLDEDRAYGNLCTAGLAFMLAVAVNRELRGKGYWGGARPEPVLTRFLDLVALGTVCDVVKLTGLNRAFVAQGLKVMAHRDNPGLRALADVAGMDATPSCYELGFILGPRINAGGRIGKADLGATLLATDDPAEAGAIAARLDMLNAERREIEAAVFEDALARTEMLDEPGAVVVAAGEGWHPGVVGIVASRLVERFDRPACVVAMDGETGTGSGRSVAGVDLGAAVIAARQSGLLIKGGGHAMAAGFTVSAGAVDELRAFLDQRVRAQGGVPPKKDLLLDGAVTARGASLDLAVEIARLAPFGPGNAEPRLALEHVRIAATDIVGKDHVKVRLAADGGGSVDAIAFRAAGTNLGQALQNSRGAPIHLAGRLKTNTWQGRTRVSFHIEDAMPVWQGGPVKPE